MNFRFLGWVVLFFILLSSVSLLISYDLILFAKIVGVIIIISISAALWIWRNQTLNRKKIRSRFKLNVNDHFWLREHIPFYKSLKKADKKIFEDRLGLFLANVHIIPKTENEMVKADYMKIGSHIILKYWDKENFNLVSIKHIDLNNNDWEDRLEEELHSK